MVKLRVRSGESIQEAVRRFRKLCERSGLRKEMRRKAYYEKPSERRRREELKRLRKARQQARIEPLLHSPRLQNHDDPKASHPKDIRVIGRAVVFLLTLGKSWVCANQKPCLSRSDWAPGKRSSGSLSIRPRPPAAE